MATFQALSSQPYVACGYCNQHCIGPFLHRGEFYWTVLAGGIPLPVKTSTCIALSAMPR